MLFRLEDAQGYNPFQVERYWTFVRRVVPRRLDYNAAILVDPPPIALDLLQVRWIVTSRGEDTVDGAEVAQDPPWILIRLPNPSTRAEMVGAWTVVEDASGALAKTLDPGFDPSAAVVLERDPGLGTSPAAAPSGTATYGWQGEQAAQVAVDAPAAGLVVVRNVYDRHWHAEVDGRSAPVLAADYLVQAVPVPSGHHRVVLRYDDPTIGYGLLGSGIAVMGLLLGALLAWRRSRAGVAIQKSSLDLPADTRQSRG
jgi:hypothetical protein